MIDIWHSDIWVGDWKEKLKEQNRLFTKDKNLAKFAEQFPRLQWQKKGEDLFYKYHPGETWEAFNAGTYFAQTYILQQYYARKSLATKESAAAAGAAAAQAAAAQANVEKSKEAAARAATVAKQSGEKAAQSAAIAERAKADYERQKSAVAAEAVKQSSASAGKGASIAARSAQEYEDMKAALKEKQVRYLDADVQAKHDQEQAEIDKAKLEARLAQEQGAREAAEERAAKAEANQIIYTYSDTGTTPYYSSGENMDNNVTLEPVAVQGTNLRNSLLFVGGVAFVWWLLKRKKRGR